MEDGSSIAFCILHRAELRKWRNGGWEQFCWMLVELLSSNIFYFLRWKRFQFFHSSIVAGQGYGGSFLILFQSSINPPLDKYLNSNRLQSDMVGNKW